MTAGIPSFERLQRDVGCTYVLGAGQWRAPVAAVLRSVRAGVAMSTRHRCYRAVLALPQGMRLPQVSCAVDAGDVTWPLLLLTPVLGPQGQSLMEMVFHVEVDASTTGPPADADRA